MQDRQGDIWIGRVSPILTTLNKSVARFDGEHFAFVGTEQGLDINNCLSMYEDHEGVSVVLVVATACSATMDKRFKKMKIAADSGDRRISAITQDLQGQFLFGYWEKDTSKTEFIKKELSVSPLKLIYQRDEAFQTHFFGGKKERCFRPHWHCDCRARWRGLFSFGLPHISQLATGASRSGIPKMASNFMGLKMG